MDPFTADFLLREAISRSSWISDEATWLQEIIEPSLSCVECNGVKAANGNAERHALPDENDDDGDEHAALVHQCMSHVDGRLCNCNGRFCVIKRKLEFRGCSGLIIRVDY